MGPQEKVPEGERKRGSQGRPLEGGGSDSMAGIQWLKRSEVVLGIGCKGMEVGEWREFTENGPLCGGLRE